MHIIFSSQIQPQSVLKNKTKQKNRSELDIKNEVRPIVYFWDFHKEERKKVDNIEHCYKVPLDSLRSQYLLGNCILIFLAYEEDTYSYPIMILLYHYERRRKPDIIGLFPAKYWGRELHREDRRMPSKVGGA